MKLRRDDGRIALAWRVVPVLFAVFLAANVVALFVLGRMGGTASGERLQLTWTAPCAAQAQPVMAERAESMGLGDPAWELGADRITLTATMPGLEDDRTAVPALLARRGQLEVRLGDRVLATEADLAGARLELDASGMPFDQLTFQPEVGQALAEAVAAAPDGELVFVMDGEVLARRPNSIAVEDSQLKVIAGEGKTRERFRRATDRAIVLGHGPLPCEVTVAGVVEAAAAR